MVLGIALGSAGHVSQGAAASADTTTIPIQLRKNFPLLMVKVDGLTVPLQFDLGDQSTVVLQKSVLDRIKAVPTGESSKLRDVKGNVFESPMYKVARLQIGSAEFTDVIARMEVHDPSYRPEQIGQKGFLGTALLKSHEVILDYPRRMMTLIPRVGGEGTSESCQGAAVPFSPDWHGQPVAEADTDLGRVMLWWDTGAPTSALSKTFAQQSAQKPSEDSVTSKRFVLGETDFGPLQFDLWDMSLPPGLSGFVGHNFFASHVVCIDFPGQRVVVAVPGTDR